MYIYLHLHICIYICCVYIIHKPIHRLHSDWSGTSNRPSTPSAALTTGTTAATASKLPATSKRTQARQSRPSASPLSFRRSLHMYTCGCVWVRVYLSVRAHTYTHMNT